MEVQSFNKKLPYYQLQSYQLLKVTRASQKPLPGHMLSVGRLFAIPVLDVLVFDSIGHLTFFKFSASIWPVFKVPQSSNPEVLSFIVVQSVTQI